MMLRRRLSILLLTLLMLPAAAVAETVPGRTSFGIRFGERLAEGYLDWIQPLAGGANDLLFVNPRFGLGDEGANELNLGLGYRHAFGERALVGGNVYFDSRRTQHDNRFSQVGMGLEFLTTWVDLRGNYYWPVDDSQLAATEVKEGTEVIVTEKTSKLYGTWSDPYATGNQIRQDVDVRVDTAIETSTTTTKKTFEDWESARQGFDAEIGVLLPLFGAGGAQAAPAIRLFAGYYHFEDDFGATIAGPKGRLEWRALPFLTIDLELYQDKELYGSKAIAAARLHTPFDLVALFQGKNPFPTPAAPAGLASRLNEQVMRDVRVQTDESGFAENKSLRKVTVDTEVERTRKYVQEEYVLLKDVVFVDGDNLVDASQAGTAEHPFSVIQTGANNVFGLKNLYVFAAGESYLGNVVLQDGTKMIGQGTGVSGMGGKSFGGDIYPVITGQPSAYSETVIPAVVTIANNITVIGFTVENGLLGIAGIGVSGAIDITNNNVANTLAGIVVATSGDTMLNISGNETFGGISGTDQDAISAINLAGIGVVNMGGNLTATVNDNVVHDSLLAIGVANIADPRISLPLSAIDIRAFAPAASFTPAPAPATAPATTDLTAARNVITDSGVGIGVANVGAGSMTATIDNNTIEGAPIGIFGLNIGSSILDMFMPAAPPLADGNLTFTATNNHLSAGVGPGLIGIGVANLGLGSTVATIGGSGSGNTVDGYLLGIGVGNAGIISAAEQATPALLLTPQPPTLSASIVGNTVSNSGIVGIGAGVAGFSPSEVLIDGNTIKGDSLGVGIGAIGSNGPLDVTVSNNQIVSETDFGVGIYGLSGTGMNVSLLNNGISGAAGVFAQTAGVTTLNLSMSENAVNTIGPAALLSTHDISNFDLVATGNTFTSTSAPAVIFEGNDNSTLSANLQGNQFTSPVMGFLAHAHDTSSVNIYLADSTFLGSLVWYTTVKGPFAYLSVLVPPPDSAGDLAAATE